jgi:prevent-host-death family protein
MRQVEIEEAKTHLARLVGEAAGGAPFVITEAGKPLVKVVPIEGERTLPRLGFMAGEFTVPDDFDTMDQEEIIALFEGST